MSFLVVFTLLLSQAWAVHHSGSGHRLRKRFSGEATYYEVGLLVAGLRRLFGDPHDNSPF